MTPNPRDYDSDSLIAKARFAAVPGGPLTFTAEGGRLRQRSDVDAFEGLAGSRFVNTVELSGDDSGERFRLSADQSLAATRAYDAADWRVYWQGTHTEQDTFKQRRAVPPRIPPVQIERSFELQDRTLGAEFTAVRSLERGAARHEFVYGFEASGTRLEEKRDVTLTNLNTGATTDTILGETFPLRDFPVSDITEVGVFLQDEIRLGDGTWSVIPALRGDYYRLSPDHRSILFGGRVAYMETNPLVSAPRLHRCLTEIFPTLRDAHVMHSWMGFVAYTFDTLPHLGVQDGIHYAMGYCGSGVSLATYFGMRVGQQVLPVGQVAIDEGEGKVHGAHDALASSDEKQVKDLNLIQPWR